jgi:hypothetical protein
MKRRSSILAAAYGALSLILVFNMVAAPVEAQPQARAQQSTSTPIPKIPPTVNGGNAKWSIRSRTFSSQYPKGFTFTLQASSTGGELKSAKVYWRHGPESQRSVPATYDPKTKTWTAVWEAKPGGDAVPAWVAVNYWFSLVDAQDNVYQTDVQHTEYADNTKEWGRAESEDIIVFWQKPLPDSVGQKTLDALAQNREKYRAAWGRLLSYKPRAILYANLKSYSEWDFGRGAEHTLGMTSSSWGGTVQRNANDIEDLTYGTVPHEIAHLYQGDLNMVAESWWIEGDATFFEIHQMYDYEARARDLALDPSFPSLRNGVSTRGNNARDGYDIGYAFIKYLTDTYGGIEVHRTTLQNMVKGKGLFDAIAAATDLPFDEVEYDFRVWLGVPEPTLPTPLPTLSVQFPPSPTYESAGPTPTP